MTIEREDWWYAGGAAAGGAVFYALLQGFSGPAPEPVCTGLSRTYVWKAGKGEVVATPAIASGGRA